jgi:hypothetical protein
VGEVDPSTEILGKKFSSPIYIAPAALAKLGHPLGEVNLTRGAGETGIMQVISSNSSCSLEELAAERTEGQELAWQLYVATDRARAEKTIKKAFNLGMSSIWLTVDAPVGGNRERDTKEKIARDPVSAFVLASTFTEMIVFASPNWARRARTRAPPVPLSSATSILILLGKIYLGSNPSRLVNPSSSKVSVVSKMPFSRKSTAAKESFFPIMEVVSWMAHVRLSTFYRRFDENAPTC